MNFQSFPELCTKCHFAFKRCICMYDFMYFCFYFHLLSRVGMQCMHAERNIILALFPLSVRLSVCLSVCTSIMPVLCLNDWPHRRTFWRSCRCIICFFCSPQPLQNTNGNLLRRRVKCMGVGKLVKHVPFPRKQYEIGPQLLWNTNTKSQAADPSVSVPVTLNSGTRGVKLFRRISVITQQSSDLERTNL